MASRVKVFVHRIVLTEHVFDKVRSIDMTLAEFNGLLHGVGVVIEEREVRAGLKEVVLYLEWARPVHVVVLIDEDHREERILTVYEPDPARWSPDHRRR